MVTGLINLQYKDYSIILVFRSSVEYNAFITDGHNILGRVYYDGEVHSTLDDALEINNYIQEHINTYLNMELINKRIVISIQHTKDGNTLIGDVEVQNNGVIDQFQGRVVSSHSIDLGNFYYNEPTGKLCNKNITNSTFTNSLIIEDILNEAIANIKAEYSNVTINIEEKPTQDEAENA